MKPIMRSLVLASILTCAAVQADDTIDWLLDQPVGAPATQPAAPASQPVAPFESRPRKDARQGTITLSSGQTMIGPITTTAEKPLRFWDNAEQTYRDVPLSLIRSMKANVLWERDQPEWHFVASGSDIKEYTGRTYPARELSYDVTLSNGQTFTGGVVAPIYIEHDQQRQSFVLNKRQKGEVGQSLSDLLYIEHVDFEPATTPTTRPSTRPN